MESLTEKQAEICEAALEVVDRLMRDFETHNDKQLGVLQGCATGLRKYLNLPVAPWSVVFGMTIFEHHFGDDRGSVMTSICRWTGN